MQSDITSLSLLETSSVLEFECDDWVRSVVYGIVIETDIHSQASMNDGKGTIQTSGHNTLVIEQQDEALRHYIEQLSDDQDNSTDQPYLKQLINNQNNSVDQAHDSESNELNSSVRGTTVRPIDESCNTIFTMYCFKI
ncbi:hypothetical protein RDI58_014932 [Solanum bulbocastanum]|uniref:Uncharacterized protein n=1 Tax=Solanum bulbocastanum TaxID=147425 RepID=A0AAN8TJJ5_SOLBU